ncbi:MAG: STAS domain-containing protein, partial [Planctomycetota bacterium]
GPVVQVRIKTATLGIGEADQLTAEVIEAMQALGPRAIINFDAVDAIASAGLSALVRIHNSAKEHKGAVAFYHCSPNLIDGFKLTRLHRLFKIAKSEAAAVKAVT